MKTNFIVWFNKILTVLLILFAFTSTFIILELRSDIKENVRKSNREIEKHQDALTTQKEDFNYQLKRAQAIIDKYELEN